MSSKGNTTSETQVSEGSFGCLRRHLHLIIPLASLPKHTGLLEQERLSLRGIQQSKYFLLAQKRLLYAFINLYKIYSSIHFSHDFLGSLYSVHMSESNIIHPPAAG